MEYSATKSATTTGSKIPAKTENGLGNDDPRARDQVGQNGMSISCLADMETLFEGQPTKKVSTTWGQ